MYDSKLMKLFFSLEKRDIRLLKKWVHSPMHNEHKEVIQFFNFLFTRHVINAKTLKKERVWKYIYPNQPYNDLRLRHLMSFSFNVLKEFVRYKQVKIDAFNQEKVLIDYYLDRKIFPLVNQNLKKATATLANRLPQDEEYHYHQYELEVLKFNLEGTQDRTRATNLTEITSHASLFFMITTLRYAYIALSHQTLKKTDYKLPLLDSVLEEVQKNDYTAYPILMIFYHGYQTLKNPTNEQHFKQLKYYLNTQAAVLGKKEQKAVLLMALNYAIKRLNTEDRRYTKEAFELYKKGLDQNLLIEDGLMSPFAYKNIVSLGIILKEYDWLESFIPNYAIYLKVAVQENYRHYSLARLLFARGDLDAAMGLLVQTEYDDIMLNIGAKVMLLKLYYQQEYWEALEALLESFRIFLNRKKALNYHKKHYTNLITWIKKIVALPFIDKSALEKLKFQIEATDPLAEREWLIEQINLLYQHR